MWRRDSELETVLYGKGQDGYWVPVELESIIENKNRMDMEGGMIVYKRWYIPSKPIVNMEWCPYRCMHTKDEE